MPTYEHKKIIDEIKRLNEAPLDQEKFATWIQAGSHLEFLRHNAHSDELLIYGSSNYSFVHSVVVANDQLETLTEDGLLYWDGDPYTSIASYAWGSGRDDVWVERLPDALRPTRGMFGAGSRTPNHCRCICVSTCCQGPP